MGTFFEFQRLLRTAALGWWNDRAMSLGASISFFTVFSLAPMLLAAISVAGLAFVHDAAPVARTHILRGSVQEIGIYVDSLPRTAALASKRATNVLSTGQRHF